MRLMLVAVIMAQDKTAEETFSKIEKTILEARSLTTAVEGVGALKLPGGDGSYKVTGWLALGPENQVRWERKVLERDKETNLALISDGKQVYFKGVDAEGDIKSAPKNVRRNLSMSLVRLGLVYGSWMTAWEVSSPADTFPISDFQLGAEEKGLRSLSYKVYIPVLRTKAEGVLWFDPKTHRIAKRSLTARNEVSEETIHETYADMVLGAEIPDEKFKLPEKKK